MNDKKYRINLTSKEYAELLSLCSDLIKSPSEVKRSLWEKVNSPIEITVSEKKKEVASRLASVRWSEKETQVFDAIAQLKKEGVEITPTTVSKRAGVHYNTAQKYIQKWINGERK